MEEKKHNIEEIPPISTADRVTLNIEKGDRKHIVSLTSQAVIKSETIIKTPNPALHQIANIGFAILYYNDNTEDFWLMIRGNKPTWLKIEEHDFETMKLLGILNEHHFEFNHIPKVLRIKKKESEKLLAMNEKFHNRRKVI